MSYSNTSGSDDIYLSYTPAKALEDMVPEREYMYFKGDCPPEEDPFAPEFARLLKETIGSPSIQQPSPHLSDVTISPQTLKRESTTPEYQESDAFLDLPASPEPSSQDAPEDDALIDQAVDWANDASSWMEFSAVTPKSPVPTRSALSHSIAAPAPLPAPVYHTPPQLPSAPSYSLTPMYNAPSYPQPVPRPFETPVYGAPNYIAPAPTCFGEAVWETPSYALPTAAPAYGTSSYSFPCLGASDFFPPTATHMVVPPYSASSHPFIGPCTTGTYPQPPFQRDPYVNPNDTKFRSRTGGFSWASPSTDPHFQGSW